MTVHHKKTLKEDQQLDLLDLSWSTFDLTEDDDTLDDVSWNNLTQDCPDTEEVLVKPAASADFWNESSLDEELQKLEFHAKATVEAVPLAPAQQAVVTAPLPEDLNMDDCSWNDAFLDDLDDFEDFEEEDEFLEWDSFDAVHDMDAAPAGPSVDDTLDKETLLLRKCSALASKMGLGVGQLNALDTLMEMFVKTGNFTATAKAVLKFHTHGHSLQELHFAQSLRMFWLDFAPNWCVHWPFSWEVATALAARFMHEVTVEEVAEGLLSMLEFFTEDRASLSYVFSGKKHVGPVLPMAEWLDYPDKFFMPYVLACLEQAPEEGEFYTWVDELLACPLPPGLEPPAMYCSRQDHSSWDAMATSQKYLAYMLGD